MTMFPSACVWNTNRPLIASLRQVKETAFHYVDIEPEALESADAVQAIKDLGLKVSCVALDHNMPAGCSLEGPDAAAVRKGADRVMQLLDKARDVGVRFGYVGSCSARKQLHGFGSVLLRLAEKAAACGIKLCVEPVPGRALPTARETLSFLARVGSPNLFLLADTGHALLSKERPSDVIAAAGNRLGYVQMNDNDGKRDRHWPLLDGRLRLTELQKTMSALSQAGYEGTIGLELNCDFASWISGIARNRNLLLRLQNNAGAVTSGT